MKKYIISVGNENFEVVVQEADLNASFTPAVPAAAAPAAPVAPVAPAPAAPAAPEVKQESAPAPKAASVAGGTPVNAPLPGTILKIVAKQGAAVKKGDVLCILEAMKMENEILSPCDATVASIETSEGTIVNSNDTLFILS